MSPNDLSILASLSQLPPATAAAADALVARLDDPRHAAVARTLAGGMDEALLSEAEAELFRQVRVRSAERIQRVRDEQEAARRRREETRLAQTLKRLHASGAISDEMLLLYGVSGDLPDLQTYQSLTPGERRRLWSDRIASKLGPDWPSRLGGSRAALPVFETPRPNHWQREGF